jgi:endoglucanase
MEDITPFVKQLITLPGLSGFEAPVRELIAKRWQPLVDELSVSKLGSLHGLKHASSKTASGSLLLTAHMDAIGLMVSGYSGAFLRVTSIGGIDPRVLPGQLVTIHGRQELPGVVSLLPDGLIDSEEKEPVPDFPYLLVDAGLPEETLKQQVQIGDLVSFAAPPLEMSGGYLSGHSLDNRASVAALTICLSELQKRLLDWNVWVAATTQEEFTLGGATTSAFEIQPDLAIAVDCTFGKGPGASDYHTFPIGEGVSIGIGANIHPVLRERLETTARDIKVPYELEVMPASSGTDAMAMQVTESGIPCEVISIPLRYMHTPVEEVAIADIEYTGRLLAAFASRLDRDFMPSLQKEMME